MFQLNALFIFVVNCEIVSTNNETWDVFLPINKKIVYLIVFVLWKYFRSSCCIFWPAFGCCAPQMLVKIFVFYGKKLKKRRKRQEICTKLFQEMDFLSLHQNTGQNILHPVLVLYLYSWYPNIRHPKSRRVSSLLSWLPVVQKIRGSNICQGCQIILKICKNN